MPLNERPPTLSRRKILILSCPKTGNTWLRFLVHYAYGLPMADLPRTWSREAAELLPQAFVAHEHLWPSEELLRWVRENDAIVLTTIRHPGDTLVSYFHFAKWEDLSGERYAAEMREDGARPGPRARTFARYSFTRTYNLSLEWERLGACVVRYEDLLMDPMAQLRRLAPLIGEVAPDRLEAAALLSRPGSMSALVDSRHFRTATAGGWVNELDADIVDMMSKIQPFRTAAQAHGYDWDPSRQQPRTFDYTAIDPFHGRECFDNGEAMGPWLPRVYLLEAGDDARKRWPDPMATAGDSFWRWMLSPAPGAAQNRDLPPQSFTNLMAAVHRMRPDVRLTYPDPLRGDRFAYLKWYVGQAHTELRLPWGVMAPTVDVFCDVLERRSFEDRQATAQ